MVTKKTQQEVTEYISERFNEKPYEWHTSSHFVDCHGCDGYIFQSETAARRYVLSDISEWGSWCEGACSDADWVSILQGIGMTLRWAKEYVRRGLWEKVARRVLDAWGPERFLSTYSGRVHDLPDGSLLYY